MAFFSQEVLHGERALGDARARLEALWDKLVELTEERDKVRRVEGWRWDAGGDGLGRGGGVCLVRQLE